MLKAILTLSLSTCLIACQKVATSTIEQKLSGTTLNLPTDKLPPESEAPPADDMIINEDVAPFAGYYYWGDWSVDIKKDGSFHLITNQLFSFGPGKIDFTRWDNRSCEVTGKILHFMYETGSSKQYGFETYSTTFIKYKDFYTHVSSGCLENENPQWIEIQSYDENCIKIKYAGNLTYPSYDGFTYCKDGKGGPGEIFK